jgi:hypothetical protein
MQKTHSTMRDLNLDQAQPRPDLTVIENAIDGDPTPGEPRSIRLGRRILDAWLGTDDEDVAHRAAAEFGYWADRYLAGALLDQAMGEREPSWETNRARARARSAAYVLGFIGPQPSDPLPVGAVDIGIAAWAGES